MIDPDDSRGDYLEPVLDALLRIERKVDQLMGPRTWRSERVPGYIADINARGVPVRVKGAPTRTPEEQGCT